MPLICRFCPTIHYVTLCCTLRLFLFPGHLEDCLPPSLSVPLSLSFSFSSLLSLNFYCTLLPCLHLFLFLPNYISNVLPFSADLKAATNSASRIDSLRFVAPTALSAALWSGDQKQNPQGEWGGMGVQMIPPELRYSHRFHSEVGPEE